MLAARYRPAADLTGVASLARWGDGSARRRPAASHGDWAMMTEILDQEVGPAPVGNMGLTIKGRARDAHSPSIVPDQPFVIVSVNKEEDLYTIALFPVGEDTAACALSEFLMAAHDHSVEYGGPEYQMWLLYRWES